MNKIKIMSLTMSVLTLSILMTIGICTEQAKDKSDITIRELEPQTVLYTIYRGEYKDVGETIGNLYGLAMKNQIWPKGSISFVYLNNPQYISGEHCLVEIRIPVGQEALKLTGTLGEMTDVKTVKAMEAAVMKKTPGQTDYSKIYNSLYLWIAKNGYIAVENACEMFGPHTKSMDYSLIESEITIPIQKIAPEN